MYRRVSVAVVIFLVAFLGSFQPTCSDNLNNETPPSVSANVTLQTHNETNYNVDFGFILCNGTIGDYVWHDKNCDGTQNEGEPGLSGILVLLKNDTGKTEQEKTNAAGYYLFENLCPGNYTVDVEESTLPPYLKPTIPNAGHYSEDSDGPLDGGPVSVTLSEDDPQNSNVDFGFACNGTIGDYVWRDLNCDGIQNKSEPGIPDVRVVLSDGSGTRETYTNKTGYYLFECLCPGDYKVDVDESTLALYLKPTKPNEGDDISKNSKGPLDGGSVHVNLFMDAPHNNSIDFGYACNGTIGDRVWIDGNCNGLQDPEEYIQNFSQLLRVNVTLYDAGSQEPLQEVPIAQNGFYEFTGLCPGIYEVEVDIPDHDPTISNNGPEDTDSEESPALVILTEDDLYNSTIDFGFFINGKCAQ